jgi:RNA polymerase sigma factor FliA
MDDFIQIWKEYKDTKNNEIREQLIIKYAPLIKYVAGKLNMHFGNYVDYDDLVSYGVFGLIDAIEKFDYTKDVKFETYASIRIRGEIIDNIRKLDWVPRTIRQKNKILEVACRELEITLGHDPNEIELAHKLGVSVDKIKDMYKEAAILSIISLDDFLEQNYEMKFNTNDSKNLQTPEVAFDAFEVKQILSSTIEKLSEKEQQVISLYYFEDLTLKEISKIMSVSESRISQLHSKAIFKLREKLSDGKSGLYT